MKLIYRSVAVALILVASFACREASARTFSAQFTCKANLGEALVPTIAPVDVVTTAYPPTYGFTYSYGKGQLNVSQAAGSGDGQIFLIPPFPSLATSLRRSQFLAQRLGVRRWVCRLATYTGTEC